MRKLRCSPSPCGLRYTRAQPGGAIRPAATACAEPGTASRSGRRGTGGAEILARPAPIRWVPPGMMIRWNIATRVTVG